MWENQTKQEQQVSTPFVRRSSGSGSDAVLFVQSVLCLIAVLICVGIRAALPGLWQDLRSLGNEMLSAGIGFEADTEFARFANAAASELDALFRGEVPAGIGGFGEKSEGTVPDGASLEEVSFDRTFELPLYGRVTSPFGFRKNPLTGYTEFHTGTDIAAAEGTPVAAALSGQVCRTGYSAGRGNYIVVRHGDGIQTLYQHLECGFVRSGEVVQAGQTLGLSGATGQVTGPHLHVEVLVNGICVNPAYAFPGLSE